MYKIPAVREVVTQILPLNSLGVIVRTSNELDRCRSEASSRAASSGVAFTVALNLKLLFLACSFIVFNGIETRLASAQEPKLVAETEPRSPEEQRKLFHLPPGFEIQLVAAEPCIR
jgi:hypothetical protein